MPSGDLRAVSVSLTNMGMLATVRGELALARDRFVEAQALADEVGDPWLVAVGRHNLGNVTRDLGDLDAAAASLRARRSTRTPSTTTAGRWPTSSRTSRSGCSPAGRPATPRRSRCWPRPSGLREEIGAPRFPPTQAALDEALAPARGAHPGRVLERGGRAPAAAADLDATVRPGRPRSWASERPVQTRPNCRHRTVRRR